VAYATAKKQNLLYFSITEELARAIEVFYSTSKLQYLSHTLTPKRQATTECLEQGLAWRDYAFIRTDMFNGERVPPLSHLREVVS
jgi:hypothetical protein